MRLRIVRPLPERLDGFELRHLAFGAAYEIGTPLCDLLVLNGFGVPEDEPPHDPGAAVKAFGTAIIAPNTPPEDKPRRKRKAR